MIENIDDETPESLREKLHAETSKISWTDLLPFFAHGNAVYVSHTLDLIEVAGVLVEDNKSQMQQWMDDDLVANVSDEQASAWHESKVTVWAVVIKPWVLVQPIVD